MDEAGAARDLVSGHVEEDDVSSAYEQPAAIQAYADAEQFGKVLQRNWEGGLLVARSTERAQGQRTDLLQNAGSKISVETFARQAKVDPRTVKSYLDAWSAAVDDGLVPAAEDLRPGDDVVLPEERWDDYYGRKRKREFPPPPPLTGSYGLIYADPPWRYDFAETDSTRVENHYPTLTVEEICELEIPAEPDCVLYMWATAPKLREALQVVAAWEFEYVTNAVWVKDRIGMGYWFRGRHELLLVGKRGNVSPPEESVRPDSVIEAPRGDHSAKPEAVYTVLESLYPDSTKIELFARGERPGWVSWGNET